MNSDHLKRHIEENAETIRRLHDRIDDTYAQKTRSPDHHKKWSEACAEFHARFDELSFPGGFETARERIMAGDLETIEAALCFVELRPYFFRSGYMYDALIRKLKHASFSDSQAMRFQVVLTRLKAWRESKKSAPSA